MSPLTLSDLSPRVGAGTTIAPNVYIASNVTIGANCVIQAGAVIGEDGFGYEQDANGRWALKPHDHGVVIGDDVHVGAGTNISRGSWRNTVIGRGARIDALVHVAHNCHVGEDAVIVANAGLGGSVTIGAGAWVGLNACIHQRVTVGERALVAMGAVVLKDVDADTTVAGVPAKVIDATRGVREGM